MDFFVCNVLRAGPSNDAGEINVRLSDAANSFGPTWFIAAKAREREILAVALTAITNGLQVAAGIDTPVQQDSVIERCYLMRPGEAGIV